MRCKASSESIEGIQAFFSSAVLTSLRTSNDHHQKSYKFKAEERFYIAREIWQDEIMKFFNPIDLILLRSVCRDFKFWIDTLDDELFWRNIQLKNFKNYAKELLDHPSEKHSIYQYHQNYLQPSVVSDENTGIHHHDDNGNQGMKRDRYRTLTLNAVRNLLMEKRKDLQQRIYLNKRMIVEKSFKTLKKDKNMSDVVPLIFIEGENSVTNGILCTYSDGSFPYEYIPTIFSNTDLINVKIPMEDGSFKINIPRLPIYSFDFSSMAHNYYHDTVFIVTFNKLLKSSWDHVSREMIPSKTGCVYILVGINWGILSSDKAMSSLKYKCEDYVDEFVPNSEILEYCNGKGFLSYIDFKPRNEKDIFTFMDTLVKLVLLKVKSYNLFGKDFLSKFDEIT